MGVGHSSKNLINSDREPSAFAINCPEYWMDPPLLVVSSPREKQQEVTEEPPSMIGGSDKILIES